MSGPKVRRPRIPPELAERIDEARGLVPFEAWVRQALEKALGEGSAPRDTGGVVPRVAGPAPPRVSEKAVPVERQSPQGASPPRPSKEERLAKAREVVGEKGDPRQHAFDRQARLNKAKGL